MSNIMVNIDLLKQSPDYIKEAANYLEKSKSALKDYQSAIASSGIRSRTTKYDADYNNIYSEIYTAGDNTATVNSNLTSVIGIYNSYQTGDVDISKLELAASGLDSSATSTSLSTESATIDKEKQKWWESFFDWCNDAAGNVLLFLSDVAACVANFAVSIFQGIFKLIEGVVDAIAALGSALVVGGSALINVFSSAIFNKEVIDIDSIINSTMAFVSKDYVGSIFDSFYENTKIGKWISARSIMHNTKFEEIIEGIGTWVGIGSIAVVATILTGGGALAGGIAAGLYGLGSGAETAWDSGFDYWIGQALGLIKGIPSALFGAFTGGQFFGIFSTAHSSLLGIVAGELITGGIIDSISDGPLLEIGEKISDNQDDDVPEKKVDQSSEESTQTVEEEDASTDTKSDESTETPAYSDDTEIYSDDEARSIVVPGAADISNYNNGSNNASQDYIVNNIETEQISNQENEFNIPEIEQISGQETDDDTQGTEQTSNQTDDNIFEPEEISNQETDDNIPNITFVNVGPESVEITPMESYINNQSNEVINSGNISQNINNSTIEYNSAELPSQNINDSTPEYNSVSEQDDKFDDSIYEFESMEPIVENPFINDTENYISSTNQQINATSSNDSVYSDEATSSINNGINSDYSAINLATIGLGSTAAYGLLHKNKKDEEDRNSKKDLKDEEDNQNVKESY